jgi:indole-3-glycerol phosphate synthase
MAVEKRVHPPRDFASALTQDRINVIAELKKASPSLGVIRENYDPPALAASLGASGAAALSVLTEEAFFQGSLAHLKAASQAVAIPILRKDFITDPWQVWETRASGADSFLLIVAVLADELLRELLGLGRSLGMEALVEVHGHDELNRALDAGAKIIGVNNRDLRNFEVNLEASALLADSIPDECIAVSESGLRSHIDLRELRRSGFDAFLIGERLMKSDDPARALKRLIDDVETE